MSALDLFAGSQLLVCLFRSARSTHLPFAILCFQHTSEPVFETLNGGHPSLLAFSSPSKVLTDNADKRLALLLGSLGVSLFANVKVVLLDRTE